jgi:hypothetical protein
MQYGLQRALFNAVKSSSAKGIRDLRGKRGGVPTSFTGKFYGSPEARGGTLSGFFMQKNTVGDSTLF